MDFMLEMGGRHEVRAGSKPSYSSAREGLGYDRYGLGGKGRRHMSVVCIYSVCLLPSSLSLSLSLGFSFLHVLVCWQAD